MPSLASLRCRPSACTFRETGKPIVRQVDRGGARCSPRSVNVSIGARWCVRRRRRLSSRRKVTKRASASWHLGSPGSLIADRPCRTDRRVRLGSTEELSTIAQTNPVDWPARCGLGLVYYALADTTSRLAVLITPSEHVVSDPGRAPTGCRSRRRQTGIQQAAVLGDIHVGARRAGRVSAAGQVGPACLRHRPGR